VPASMGGGGGSSGGGAATEGLLCANVAGLSSGQRKLCQLYLDHMPWVGRGARSGVAECQWQFRDRRWNCSAIQDASVMGPVLDIGKSPTTPNFNSLLEIQHLMHNFTKFGQLTISGSNLCVNVTESVFNDYY
jgi:wingless-type MMTV integration site family, member 5